MDTITEIEGRERGLLQRASSFAVTVSCSERKGYTQIIPCEDWRETRDTYLEPPSGYQAIGISACDEQGVPFAKLTAWDMAQLRSGT